MRVEARMHLAAGRDQDHLGFAVAIRQDVSPLLDTLRSTRIWCDRGLGDSAVTAPRSTGSCFIGMNVRQHSVTSFASHGRNTMIPGIARSDGICSMG